MINCKNCNKTIIVKNGIARGKQRYKCKDCGCNFMQGDARVKKENEAKKSLAVLLYSLGRGSFRFIGRILNVSNVSVYKWINKIADQLEEPKVADNIKEVEFDEMRHFINSKKTRNLKECTFYTDDWESFRKVLPSERHIIGKQHTHAIERDNSNTRHYLG